MTTQEVLTIEEAAKLDDDQLIGVRIRIEIDYRDLPISDKRLRQYKWECIGEIIRKDEFLATYTGATMLFLLNEGNTDFTGAVIPIKGTYYFVRVGSEGWQPVIDFDRITQNRFTNELPMLSSKGKESDITGSLKLTAKGITAKIEGFDKLVKHTIGMNANTWIFFTYLMKLTYCQGVKNDSITFTLDEWMNLKGYANSKPMRDKARLQLRKELSLLRGAFIKYRHKQEYFESNLIQGFKSSKGRYNVKFTDDFAKVIQTMGWMYLPNEVWRLNHNINPNTYFLISKISLQKSLNYYRNKGDLISVLSLLKSCPELPEYEKTKAKGEIKRRIIEPFERDLDAIKSIRWNYQDRSGKVIDRTEIKDYHAFIKLYVKVEWLYYPETEMLEKSTLREIAEKKKEAAEKQKAAAEKRKAKKDLES
jgi:hypothetical protein